MIRTNLDIGFSPSALPSCASMRASEAFGPFRGTRYVRSVCSEKIEYKMSLQ